MGLGECEGFILCSEYIGGLEYTWRTGWLAFGGTGTGMSGSPRRVRDLFHWARSIHSGSPLRRQPLPSRLPTCPFNPLTCLASWIVVTMSSLPFLVKDATRSLAELHQEKSLWLSDARRHYLMLTEP